MVTRALHDSGLRLVGTSAEELIEAADDNPEGFWENKAIRACNDELLEATGGALGQPAGPASGGGGRSPRRARGRGGHGGPGHTAPARPLGIQGSAHVPHRGLLARPRARAAVRGLRAPPDRGRPVAQAPQPELLLAGPVSVGALLRHAARPGPARAPHRQPLRHVLRRPGSRDGTAVRLRRARAGHTPRPARPAAPLDRHRPRRRRGERRRSGALCRPVQPGRGAAAATGPQGRGSRAPPRPRRRGGAAPRRPAAGGHRTPAGARGGVPRRPRQG